MKAILTTLISLALVFIVIIAVLAYRSINEATPNADPKDIDDETISFTCRISTLSVFDKVVYATIGSRYGDQKRYRLVLDQKGKELVEVDAHETNPWPAPWTVTGTVKIEKGKRLITIKSFKRTSYEDVDGETISFFAFKLETLEDDNNTDIIVQTIPGPGEGDIKKYKVVLDQKGEEFAKVDSHFFSVTGTIKIENGDHLIVIKDFTVEHPD